MSGLLDFMERAVKGPIKSSQDFMMKDLIPGIRKVLKEFEIRYLPERPICTDNQLCDRLYAGEPSLLRGFRRHTPHGICPEIHPPDIHGFYSSLFPGKY